MKMKIIVMLCVIALASGCVTEDNCVDLCMGSWDTTNDILAYRTQCVIDSDSELNAFECREHAEKEAEKHCVKHCKEEGY